jgi:hypothetical protein
MQVVDVTRIRSRFSLAGHPQVVEMLCPHCLKEATFAIKGWSEHAGQLAVSEKRRARVAHRRDVPQPARTRRASRRYTTHPDPVGRTSMEGADTCARCRDRWVAPTSPR